MANSKRRAGVAAVVVLRCLLLTTKFYRGQAFIAHVPLSGSISRQPRADAPFIAPKTSPRCAGTAVSNARRDDSKGRNSRLMHRASSPPMKEHTMAAETPRVRTRIPQRQRQEQQQLQPHQRRGSAATTATCTATAVMPSSSDEGVQQPQAKGNEKTRAEFLRRAGSSVVGAAVAALVARPKPARSIDLGGVEFGFGDKNRLDIPPEDNPDGLKSPRPLAYRVEYSDPPTTVPFTKPLEVSQIAWVGAGTASAAYVGETLYAHEGGFVGVVFGGSPLLT